MRPTSAFVAALLGTALVGDLAAFDVLSLDLFGYAAAAFAGASINDRRRLGAESAADAEGRPLASGGDGAITITLAEVSRRAIAGRQVRFSLDSKGRWSTHSDLPPRFLPASVRETTSQ